MISTIKRELQETLVEIIKSNTEISLFDFDKIQEFIKIINDHLGIIIQRMVFSMCFKMIKSNNLHYSNLCRFYYKKVNVPLSVWMKIIDWNSFSPKNFTEESVRRLKIFQNEINYPDLLQKINIFEFDYNALVDYNSLNVRCNIYKEELIMTALHPSRIQKYLDQGIDLDDFI